jgi:hypothetical protein
VRGLQALAALVRPPRRSRLVLTLVVAVVVGGVGWWAGMDAAHALALALAVVAIGIVWVAVPDHEHTGWRDEPIEQPEGARHDVVRLSWMLRSRGGAVQSAGVRRIRDLAQERLDPYRLHLDSAADRAAIEDLIGAEAYATLHPRSDRLPKLAAVTRCLDRLDRLDRTPADAFRRAP